MIKFIFIRHGLTLDNESMKLSGFIDSELSDLGKKQVKQTSVRLKDEKIDLIYSSPLKRAMNTAKEISKINSLDINICDEFKEMNFGDFEGLTFKEIEANHKEEYERLKNGSFEYSFPNGENMIGFHDRISNKIDHIIKNYDGKTVLIVSHAGVIRACLSHLISKDHTYHWNFKIDNCSMTIVEVVDNFSVIHNLNNTEHLR
ncbi:histidine phosphatase family protein [Tepidibacter hydrothermalis]|uniref:Histidine phosphatase family protein n=1 Tax=Tepidibacter hydrothermalis TaxID=3036126 RepID=A0ABY8EDI2_9FIRM|nr:histidine phosphatase family protein [Tepidibacter hydrothermalis]WFD09552.1 histidine phosphatase family protein [Tepidibacter hydrothermalis]